MCRIIANMLLSILISISSTENLSRTNRLYCNSILREVRILSRQKECSCLWLGLLWLLAGRGNVFSDNDVLCSVKTTNYWQCGSVC